MKHFKIFSIVLGAHLLAVPIVIIQISRGTGSVSEELAKEVFSDPISLQQVSSIKPTSLNIYNSKPTVVHTVQQGENPSAIASKYGMDMRRSIDNFIWFLVFGFVYLKWPKSLRLGQIGKLKLLNTLADVSHE